MEDGFPMLEEFDDEHALERQLESLLDDASDHLPVRLSSLIWTYWRNPISDAIDFPNSINWSFGSFMITLIYNIFSLNQFCALPGVK